MIELGKKAKAAERILSVTNENQRNSALLAISSLLLAKSEAILSANALDVREATGKIPAPMIDRLTLTKERLEKMAKGMRDVAQLPDPLNRILSDTVRPNGLKIVKKTIPIGVIGIIFEARPNVCADSAALTLKSGNCVILRGGKEALNTNIATVNIIREALCISGLPEDCVQVVTDTSHESARALMTMNGYVDLLIPRGGRGLIRAVAENSTVPVIETGAGTCHVYVAKDADIAMAQNVIYNAKVSRPSVCNACECVLIHESVKDSLPFICKKLLKAGVEIRGDEEVCALVPEAHPASEDDWGAEYNDLILAMRIVKDTDEAIDYIESHGTHHSESIITEDESDAAKFMNAIDSAAVYWNASTRFTDGGEFGMGAEIGISTQKLHARGPLGLSELCSTKYFIYGKGQIRE